MTEDQFKELLRAAAITPDKPLYAALTTVHAAAGDAAASALALNTKMEDVYTRPAVDVERAIRKAMSAAVPEFTSLWRSKGRAWLAIAMAVGVTVVAGGAALVSYQIGFHVGNENEERREAWCASHVTVYEQKEGCFFPVTRPASR